MTVLKRLLVRTLRTKVMRNLVRRPLLTFLERFGPWLGRRFGTRRDAMALVYQGLSPVAGVRIKNETARSNIVAACQHRRYRQEGRAL